MPKFIQKHKELITEIVAFTLYVLLVVMVLWGLTINHVNIASFFGIEDQVTLDLGSIASILSIVAAAMAIVISNRQEAKKSIQSSKDQIYQQLELESINLFRFEIDNPELARLIWEDTKDYELLKDEKNEAYRVLQHICQILNLFEMAVRHKYNNVAHDDVFKSWEAWIYDLCRSKLFLHYWYLEDIRSNYIELFQKIVDAGLLCAHGKEHVDAVTAIIETSEDLAYKKFETQLRNHLSA